MQIVKELTNEEEKADQKIYIITNYSKPRLILRNGFEA